MTWPFENDTGAIIKKLTEKGLKANKKRNFFIIAAIMLTTLLIGSVFSVGISLVESVKAEQIRLVGTKAQAAVGNPTGLQIEKLQTLDYVKRIGINNSVGFVKNTETMGRISLTLHYFDKTEWEDLRAPACMDIQGNYPKRENEIMVSVSALKQMGIDAPMIGMEIPLAYYTDNENKDMLFQETFRLSGWFTSYTFVQSNNTTDVILVSEKLSQRHGKTAEKDGSVSIQFVDGARVSEYCSVLASDLGLSENQPIVEVPIYNADEGGERAFLFSLCAIAVFLIFTGYLLIYNVMYISVSCDVRFYGLLKTLGATQKQIKQSFVRQIKKLCLIGIPIGLVLSLTVSLKLVPFFLSALGAVPADGAVVSFSPAIYISAAIFPMLTAIGGASRPAKRASEVSPVEAQKYTGMTDSGKIVRSSAHGNLYRMALRNVFRDKKRAGVVLFSLFLGITTFLSVVTLVFSVDVEEYIDSNFENDFVLENDVWPEQKFETSFIEQLASITGVEEIHSTTFGKTNLDYSDSFDAYISDHPEREQTAGLTEQEIAENFRGFILGVDRETLEKDYNVLGTTAEAEAFECGELAFIATDHPELFSKVHQLTLSLADPSFSDHSKWELTLGGFVPFSYKNVGSGLAPTIVVSNTAMMERFEEPIIVQIGLNVSKGSEQKVLIALKQLIRNHSEISMKSKWESTEELNQAKTAMLVFGVSLSFAIALIGVLNFVNTISVSVVTRKRELAILKSIGMSHRQIRKMLISEGLYYGIVTLVLVLSIGNLTAYGLFRLFQQQMSFAVFHYPFVPAAVLIFVILTVCFITPERVYRSLNQKTIVEHLREVE